MKEAKRQRGKKQRPPHPVPPPRGGRVREGVAHASLFLCFFASLLLIGCATSSIFQPLGDNISSPNGMAIDVAANRLYLVNSNSNVLYDWEDGSLQVYDITDPLSPQLMDTAATESFSGEAIKDDARNLLYVSNRYSEQKNVTEDHLLIINIDETSGAFLNVDSILTGKDPYGLFCCYPADRLWISTGNDDLEYVDLASLSRGSISLLRSLSNGTGITKAEAAYIAVKGNQAFIPRNRGGLFVVNLDEAGDDTKNPVDYFIEDFKSPGGIATDGTYIYMVDEEQDGSWKPYLMIIDPATLVPLTDNDTTQVKDKDDDGLLVAQIEVQKQPQTVFLTSAYAFVTAVYESNKDGYVSVVDLASQTLVTDIAVQQEPFGMALYAPGGVEQYLYVGNVESNTLSIIDIPSLTVVGTYP